MNREPQISIQSGRFRKLRAWNRRRNYLFKQIKFNIRIYIAKIIWDKRKKNLLDITAVKTILLLRNEGTIGDMVVYSPLVKTLYESGYIVDLLLTKSSSVVMTKSPYVRNIYEADDVCTEDYLKSFKHSVPDSIMKTLNDNHYDLVIDPSLFDTPVHRMPLLREINARSVLGFNKWKNINHYSASLDFKNGTEHITKTVQLIAEYMKLSSINLRPYNLYIPDNISDEVKKFLNSLNNKQKVIINIFAGNKERCFSQQQLSSIIDKIREKYAHTDIILLDHRKEISLPLADNVVINPFRTLQHVMALICQADLIITPDTSIVHISAAWEKPLICVYKNVDDNNHLWAPGYTNASQIIINTRLLYEEKTIPDLILREIEHRELLAANKH